MQPLSPESSDGVVIADVLDGQRERFALLVRRYEGPLLRAAQTRLPRRDWAEDAVQETFFSAFKSLHTYNSQYSFRTWLWTILINQCRRQLARRGRAPQIISAKGAEELENRQSGGDTPLMAALASERRQQLALMLARLSEVEAGALRLRFFGGLKFHEIATVMQCSLSTAKLRVRRGLGRLTVLLSAEENAPPAEDNLSASPAAAKSQHIPRLGNLT